MNVIKISGGLGNQMFQYAFALAHISRDREVKLDINPYGYEPQHQGFELQKLFRISTPIATARDYFYFITSDRRAKGEEKKYRLKENRYYASERKNNLEFQFAPELLSMDHTYFDGFWQNYKYFESISETIRDCYRFDDILEKNNILLRKQIVACSSVAIHVRRGDYLQPPFNKWLNVVPCEYYKESIEIIKGEVADPVFFVFSDDMDWAKKNISANKIVYVKGNSGSTAYKDMQLMSLCDYHIIANSSFSWWAAWLADNPDNITIAPRPWFKNFEDKGPVLNNWLTVTYE